MRLKSASPCVQGSGVHLLSKNTCASCSIPLQLGLEQLPVNWRPIGSMPYEVQISCWVLAILLCSLPTYETVACGVLCCAM